jgi:FtsZ-interacting cell division protein ZipA
MAIRNVTRAGVGLVIGIIILGLLVFGGLWLVRERGDQARRQEAINIANEQLKSESEQGVALNNDKNQSSNSQSQNSGSQSSNSTSQSGSSTSNTSSNASELPQTGPKETTAVVLGFLTFAVVSFVRSRKLLSNQS